MSLYPWHKTCALRPTPTELPADWGGGPWLVIGERADGTRLVLANFHGADEANQAAERYRQHLEDYRRITVEAEGAGRFEPRPELPYYLRKLVNLERMTELARQLGPHATLAALAKAAAERGLVAGPHTLAHARRLAFPGQEFRGRRKRA